MNADDRLERARQKRIAEHFEAPVQALRAYVKLLDEQLDAEADDGILTDLARITQAIDQLDSLLDQAVTLAGAAETSPEDGQRLRHDLRNALGAVTGYSELIAEDLEDSDMADSQVTVCLERLQREAGRLLETLDVLGRESSDITTSRLDTSDIEDVLASLSDIDDDREELTGKILVVDDNESNRELLCHQLNAQGHETLAAASGREALELMAEQHPDLVLLDLIMPDMNGFEVLRTMHGRKELRSIPVIVITGLHDQQGVVRCIEAGAQDYLLKPLNPVVLRARIRAGLERKAWHDREQSYQRELERSYRFIRKVFGRYLSDDVVRQILDGEHGLKLGGGLQTVTLMMTDLRGFTELSQRISPVEVVSLLNLYLHEMSAIIVRHGGTIDEIIGDAILVLFGAPLLREDDALRAVACAIEMQQAMAAVNKKALEQGLPRIEMGIGLNTGEVVVGNIGSEIRSKYAVVGHHVNLTGRIESFTIGGQILASEFTIRAAGDAVRLGRSFQVDAKGVEEPVTLHEITGLGGAWDLTLNPEQTELCHLEAAMNLKLVELTGKKLDGPEVDARLVALAGNRGLLACVREIEPMTNVRLTFDAVQAPDVDRVFYAKVIEPCTEGGPGRYHIALTSVAASTRLHMLVEQAASMT
jgi:adenylate cyclase